MIRGVIFVCPRISSINSSKEHVIDELGDLMTCNHLLKRTSNIEILIYYSQRY